MWKFFKRENGKKLDSMKDKLKIGKILLKEEKFEEK